MKKNNKKVKFIDINKYIDKNINDIPFLNKTIIIGGAIMLITILLALLVIFLVIYYN